jgi:hypothetical protein
VAELVAEHEPGLLLVQPLQQRRVEHDERLVHPDRHGVPDREVGDVQLGQFTDVEGAGRLRVEAVDLRELPVVDTDRRAEELQPERALVDQPGQLAQHVVEAAQLAQRHQRAAVGGVFPGT